MSGDIDQIIEGLGRTLVGPEIDKGAGGDSNFCGGFFLQAAPDHGQGAGRERKTMGGARAGAEKGNYRGQDGISQASIGRLVLHKAANVGEGRIARC
jgi:hypothetical protein